MIHAFLLSVSLVSMLAAPARSIRLDPVVERHANSLAFSAMAGTATRGLGRAARVFGSDLLHRNVQKVNVGEVCALLSAPSISSERTTRSRSPRLFAQHRHQGNLPFTRTRTSLGYSRSAEQDTHIDISVRERMLRLLSEIQMQSEIDNFEKAAKLR